MKHSKIIKDLATGQCDLFSALKSLKVLLKDLAYKEPLEWVEKEMMGYQIDDPLLPAYRKTTGTIYGNILAGNAIQGHVKMTEQPLPTSGISADILRKITAVHIIDGVPSLLELAEPRNIGKLKHVLPPNTYELFRGFSAPVTLSHVYVRVDAMAPRNILTNIENKILDILYLLEQEGGNLDNMDITLAPNLKTPVATQINNIIYNDHSIAIGDGNKISDSNIATVKGD